MEMFLSHADLIEMTGRKVNSAQKKVLNYMGIPYKERADGSVAVLRDTVKEQFGCAPSSSGKSKPKSEPNWNALA